MGPNDVDLDDHSNTNTNAKAKGKDDKKRRKTNDMSTFRGIEEKSIKDTPIEEVFMVLQTSEAGLSTEEATRRFDEQGPNALPEESTNQFLVFFGFDFIVLLYYLYL